MLVQLGVWSGGSVGSRGGIQRRSGFQVLLLPGQVRRMIDGKSLSCDEEVTEAGSGVRLGS